VVVQYWMFYAFNKGPLNTHEGDWEMVQVVLGPARVPREAMYSQHTGGQKTEWSNVGRDGDHIKVYVARGSHANYFRPYQGAMGMARDIVGDNGRALNPGDYALVHLGEANESNHAPDQDWLDYAGRWGEYGSEEDELRGKRGPYGPAYREDGEMWHFPLNWGDDLQSVDSTSFRIDWFFYNFLMIFFTIALLSVCVKILQVYRRHRKTGLGKRVFSILYVDGFNLKSIGNLLGIIGMILAALSIFYPWYEVRVDIPSGSYSTDGMVEVVSIDGSDGIRINMLESNSGLTQVFAFPIPFSVLIVLGIFFIVLSSVGIQKSAGLGRKYLRGGIKMMLPMLILLVFVSQVSEVLDLAPVDVPDEAGDLVAIVSDSPAGGDEITVIEEYGTVHVKWGIEKGGYFLLSSGALLFLGGVLEIIARREFFRSKETPGAREEPAGTAQETGEKTGDGSRAKTQQDRKQHGQNDH